MTMTVIPSEINVAVGSTITVNIVGADTAPIISLASDLITTSDIVATAIGYEFTVTGVLEGSGSIVITDGTTPTSVAVVVTPSFRTLTVDGTGEGYDTSVFGRQYAINQNLSIVNDLSAEIREVCGTLKGLAISNQITNAADLAAIITSLVVLSNKLDRITARSNPVVIR